jgi:NADH-quinone oxidoreductase subunit G
VPRRAGERGAVDAGALPGLLPGGRTTADGDAVAALWGALPTAPGRDLDGILAAARDGGLSALVVGAVDPADCPDPWLALDALDRVPFLVSLELRRSPVTDRADVVLPVAAAVEKAGTYLDWEGRARPFDAVLHRLGGLSDSRVLHMIADELDRPLGLPDVASARAEIARLGAVTTAPRARRATPRRAGPRGPARRCSPPGTGCSTTARCRTASRSSPARPSARACTCPPRRRPRSARAGRSGDRQLERGSLTLPLVVAEMPDRVVWVPMRTPRRRGPPRPRGLPGSVVRIAAAHRPQDGAVA